MASFTLTHRAETIEDVARMLITASASGAQDQPIRIPLMPMQARYLGRALEEALAQNARHATIMASVAEARRLSDEVEAKAQAVLLRAKTAFWRDTLILLGSVGFMLGGLIFWVAA